jgi:hypothetical protein
METQEKKELISKETLKNVATIEKKITESFVRFATKYNCSLNELSVRIVGRENELQGYALYKNMKEKLAIITCGEFIKLSRIEKKFGNIDEDKINETIYRSLSKILLGADDPVKINNIVIIISMENDKPKFVLYKNNNFHKHIESWSIL